MISGIINTIRHYLTAFKYILKYKLYSYFLISGLISIILAVLLIFLLITQSENLVDFILSLTPYSITNDTLGTSLDVITGAVLFILFFLTYKYVIIILVSPFLSPLSERVEGIVKGIDVSPPPIKDFAPLLIRSIRIAIRSFFKELLLTIPLIVLSFIPFLGIFPVILIFLIQSYYAGLGTLDFYQERHRNVIETFLFSKEKRTLTTGIGAGYLGILFIPFLGVIIAPVISCIAGTIAGAHSDLET